MGESEPKSHRSNRWPRIGLYAGIFVWCLAFCIYYTAPNRRSRSASPSATLDPIKIPAGEHHKAVMQVEENPGVSQARFDSTANTIADEMAQVIGIVVNGQAYAFPIYMLADPTEHVLNLVLEGRPITVTYCNMSNCSRVLTKTDNDQRIELHIVGVDVEDKMVVKLNDTMYGHESSALPLDDYPFELVLFEDWVKRYPETIVYGGVQSNSSEPFGSSAPEKTNSSEP